jgi:hypothetical protein
VIPLLEQDFYVACFSYDGFDETEDTVFPGMLEETEKIENYIRENFDGRGDCAYADANRTGKNRSLCQGNAGYVRY